MALTESEILAMDVPALEREVEKHDRLYWELDAPEIPDTLYDLLVERLKVEAPDSPVLSRVGGKGRADAPSEDDVRWDSLATGDKIRHAHPMLSLDKCYSEDELLKWFARFEGGAIASHKVDGVAMSLRYDASGKLALAVTRGDGAVGEVITENARRVLGVPKAIDAPNLEVRGEAYMPLSTFRERFARDFANPRNLTAGALKQKDPEKTGAYGIAFFAYDGIGLDVPTESDKRVRLTELGFTPAPGMDASAETGQAVFDEMQRMRDEIDFEVDGVVYKVNDIAQHQTMGHTAHHPRYAIAYKYQGESGFTLLRGVEWNVSRTGSVNPVALVEPVSLSGVTVGRVSLHNLGIIEKLADQPLGRSGGAQRKALGRRLTVFSCGRVRWKQRSSDSTNEESADPVRCARHRSRNALRCRNWSTGTQGARCNSRVKRRGKTTMTTPQPYPLSEGATVLVTRRGGVIPHIEAITEPGTSTFELPTRCPSCGVELRRTDDFLTGDHLPSCGTRAQRQIEYFVSVTDMQGIGPKLIEQLYDRELVQQPADLFELSIDDLLMLDRMGQRSADNVLAAVEARRSIALPTFVAALGISDLGAQMARVVTRRFRSLGALRAATRDELLEVDGVGEIVADKIIAGLNSNEEVIERLLEHIEVEPVEEEDVPDGDGSLAGKKFVFTGGMESMTRGDAQKRVRELGGETPSGISGAIDFLVLGDKDFPRFEDGWRSSKLKKAEKIIDGGSALKIISETEFLRMVSESA